MAGFHIDRDRGLTAITGAAGRTAALIASIPDPNAPTAGLEWTLGQTASHLVASMRMHREWLRGEGAVDYGIPDLGQRNLESLESLNEKDPTRLAALLREHADGYSLEAAEQPVGATVPAEVGPPLTIEEISCVMLGELVVHGFDIARTLGHPWPIGRDEANLIALGSMAILPQFVNQEAARGADVSYEIRLRGGPRVFARFRDGTLTVAPSDGTQRVDATISADPSSFLLVAYGRAGQWGPLLRGKLLAWGRRPMAALKLSSYLRNP